ncbi:hypothetical protein M422DRAFT_783654 [Sphaerobolus stellatus SS14]|uniref:Unplaced genomic scaffold SPHSTscaffold_158, whole genome shotgun sequence n=1 Tax=Sphaerobolus stellatus (strain SS14) TaxID=990650 RepID=A0A0C9UBL2_SPHS4|nr:hypothetical protein M422DRAFT_783654 [Sphaerobolus stellatus SS14]
MSCHHQQQSKMSSIVEFSSPSSGDKPTKKKPQHHSDSEECLMKDQLKERCFNKCFKTDENDEETALSCVMVICCLLTFSDAAWILKGVNSQFPYEFICKGISISISISTCVQWDDSTSILHTHVMNCIHDKQKAKPETKTMIDYVSEHQYSDAQFQFLFRLWVSHHYQPFSIVSDSEFIEIVQMLYAAVKVPSQRTVTHDVKEIFTMTREKVKAYFFVS